MADPVAPTPAPAPAAAPAAPNPTVQRNAASGAVPRRAIITNPAPVVSTDEDVLAAQAQEEAARQAKEPKALPQSTIDEMEAGRNALIRNKPRVVDPTKPVAPAPATPPAAGQAVKPETK